MGSAIARLYRSAQTERQKHLWIRKLDGLNDHLLRDIGIARHEIPGYVKRHMAEQAVPSEGLSLAERAGQAVRAAHRLFRAWQDGRRTARQLRRLDRKQLPEIDIQPNDFNWLSRDFGKHWGATAAAANDDRDRTAA